MILPIENFTSNSKGEDFVWEKFAELLPFSYVSFHNYYLGLKQADVILLVPNRGVLIIEIKGFLAKNIIDVPDRSIIRLKGQPPIPSPFEQAIKYRNILLNDYLLKNNINSVYVASAVCYPFVSKQEYCGKLLSKVSHERLTIVAEDFSDAETLEKKINDIFDLAYETISVPSLIKYGFSAPLLEQVGNIISENFRNEKECDPINSDKLIISEIKERNKYSRFICHSSADAISSEYLSDIVADWTTGVKIYFYSDDDATIDKLVESLKSKIQDIELTERKDFNFIDNNTFLFSSGYAPMISKSFELLNGENYVDHLDELEFLHTHSSFNKDQYIIEHANLQDIIVKAGAGTGKTYSIVSRINYLVWKKDYRPQALRHTIAMITFTNESADAMKEKLSQNFLNYYLLTKNVEYLTFIESVEDMNISTIHSMAKKILQKYASYIGLGKDFSIVTGNYKRSQLLQSNLNEFVLLHADIENKIDLSMFHLGERLLSFLDKLDNKNVDIVSDMSQLNFGRSTNPIFDELIGVLCHTQKQINEYCKTKNSVSLGDLIRKLKTLYINLDDKNVEIQDNVDFLFVDEFQDTDDVQIELMTTFKKIFNFKFFVVGDIKQCIYRFRGAEVKAFDTLIKNNSDAFMIISLNKNYRTDTLLLNKLNTIFTKLDEKKDIEYSKDDVLMGTKEYCDKPEIYEIKFLNSEMFENKLVRSLAALKQKLSSDKDKIAILVRYNWQIAEIREICERNKISIETEIGGELFKIDPTIDLFKLILALKFNTSPKHLYNLYTTSYVFDEMPKVAVWNECQNNKTKFFYDNLPSNLSKWNTYIERLHIEPVLKVIRDIVENVRPWEVFAKKIKATDEDVGRAESYYMRNLDQLFEKLIIASNTDYLTINKLSDYLEIMILTRKEEEARASYDIEKSKCKIICTTVHKSKGLEFDTVLLPYCDFDISCAKSKGDVDLIYSDNEVGYRIIGNSFKVEFENNLYQDFQKNEVLDRKHEEARILYVALTRAIKRIVYFTNAGISARKYKSSWENLIKEV